MPKVREHERLAELAPCRNVEGRLGGEPRWGTPRVAGHQRRRRRRALGTGGSRTTGCSSHGESEQSYKEHQGFPADGLRSLVADTVHAHLNVVAMEHFDTNVRCPCDVPSKPPSRWAGVAEHFRLDSRQQGCQGTGKTGQWRPRELDAGGRSKARPGPAPRQPARRTGGSAATCRDLEASRLSNDAVWCTA